MSTVYNIDFSDPVKAGFQIRAGAYNGPGGDQANTTLRLFGRGAREWGEAVDENLVRLAENFASASAPSVATSGQMWIETSIYYRNTSESDPLAGWYRYNLQTKSWALLGGTGIVDGTAQSPATIGHYYASAGVLRAYYSLGKYEPAAYVVRASTTGVGAPGSLVPSQKLYIYDANANSGAGEWVPQSATIVTPTGSPSNPTVGMLWFNEATGNLSVYNGTTWQNLLGPAITAGQSTSSGILDMNSFKIINVAAPTTGGDATNKTYVDTAISTLSSSVAGAYLLKAGGTITGNLIVNGTTTLASAAVMGNTSSTTLGVTGLSTLGSLTVTGASTLTGGATMGAGINMGNNAISNLTMSGAGTGAATKAYVDSAVSSSLTFVYTSGYIYGNGTAGNPIALNLALVRAAVFATMTCTDYSAWLAAYAACGGGGPGVGSVSPVF